MPVCLPVPMPWAAMHHMTVQQPTTKTTWSAVVVERRRRRAERWMVVRRDSIWRWAILTTISIVFAAVDINGDGNNDNIAAGSIVDALVASSNYNNIDFRETEIQKIVERCWALSVLLWLGCEGGGVVGFCVYLSGCIYSSLQFIKLTVCARTHSSAGSLR